MRVVFKEEYFPNQFTVVPKDGDVVKVGEQELRWYALDSSPFNVKLFQLAYGAIRVRRSAPPPFRTLR